MTLFAEPVVSGDTVGNLSVAGVAIGLVVRLFYWYGMKVLLPESEAKQAALQALPRSVEKLSAVMDAFGTSLLALTKTSDGSYSALKELIDFRKWEIAVARNHYEVNKRLAELFGDRQLIELMGEARGLQHAMGDLSQTHPKLTPEQEAAAKTRPQ